MSDVFILGAGFSRAISDQMPLTQDLSRLVLERYLHVASLPPDIRHMIDEDFEKALTYLSQDKPWVSETDHLRHRALYLDLTDVIRGILHERCRSPDVWVTNTPPMWLEALVTFWHDRRATVITLNYDTLIERVASSINWRWRSTKIPTGALYPIPMALAEGRGGLIVAPDPVDTFQLFKLHGSINWAYSGRSEFFGEELFYVPCIGGVDGTFDACEGRDPEKGHWTHLGDKKALIIPPTLDKRMYFQHESLRSMWFQAGQAIRKAKRIVCMGYSLPASDLTMAQFLRSSAPDNAIPFDIVDVVPKSEHFAKVLGTAGFEFQQGGLDSNAVRHYVVNHCVPNQEARDYVIRMTV
jgi:hypothetical protein